MGRAPCCDKVGLKRGPWTPEEDHVLISFIIQHGHSNWRALPKQAGLLRCGKSCRLRWINYLKPDIKRGNFSKEEEDTIIQLHEMMGNRWSAIAARLPGRTDNEIKNVWHTHLKKRLNKQNQKPKSQGKVANKQHCDNNNNNIRNNNNNININVTTSNSTSENDYNYNYNLYEISDGKCEKGPNYSQQSYSSDDFSSITEVSSVQVPNSMANATDARKYDENKQYELDELPIVDATFWSSQEFSYDDLSMDFEIPSIIEDEKIYGENNNFSTMCMANTSEVVQGGGADFWFDLFVNGSAPELLEF